MNWTLGKVHRCFQKPSSYKDVRPDRLLQDDVVSDFPGNLSYCGTVFWVRLVPCVPAIDLNL